MAVLGSQVAIHYLLQNHYPSNACCLAFPGLKEKKKKKGFLKVFLPLDVIFYRMPMLKLNNTQGITIITRIVLSNN